MPPLGGNSEPVRFAFLEATQLAAALRAAATELEAQVPTRQAWATEALKQWRGRFADEFRAGHASGVKDAGAFVAAMRKAATDLDALAQEAKDEQQRRNTAASWQAEQDSEGWIEKKWEGFWGTDEKPPDTTVKPGRTVSSSAPPTGSRF